MPFVIEKQDDGRRYVVDKELGVTLRDDFWGTPESWIQFTLEQGNRNTSFEAQWGTKAIPSLGKQDVFWHVYKINGLRKGKFKGVDLDLIRDALTAYGFGCKVDIVEEVVVTFSGEIKRK